MKHSHPALGAGLLAAVAALTLAACNRNGSTSSNASAPITNYPNGAYVAGSNNTALPVRAPPPPRGTYEAVARIPPPPIPVYDQPPMPEPGDVWTPGYWAWSDADDDYYWAPGTWVAPPEPGLYWTPGYWRYWDGDYLYSPGYWGPAVGFYGGIDYGWGYYGLGYAGGRWEDGRFWYNRRANNFGRWRIERAYDQPVRTIWNRASYNGGPGGLRVGPTPLEAQAARARHAPPSRAQVEQTRSARAEPQLHARFNRGAPPIAGVSRPGVFHGPGAVVTGARSPGAWTPPSRPQGRQQPGFAGRPGPGGAPAPSSGAPRFEAAPRAAPFTRGPAPAAHERAAPAARVPEARAPFAASHAPSRERPGPAFTRREAAPEFRTPPRSRPGPRPSAPAFRPAPAQPEFRAAPRRHPAPTPQFHPAPASRPAPAFHAAPAPSLHAAPARTPSFHAAPAPAVHPAPAPHPAAPHPAAPAQPKHH